MTESMHQWLLGNGLRLSPSQRATHTCVLGQTGMGKSRALESWIMQDILAGHGVAVIDPHGDLYQNLVLRLSRLIPRHAELLDRIILLDPNDPTWTVGFNPLEPIPGILSERLAWFLTDVILKIWKMDAVEVPRTQRLITHSFLVLAERRRSLVDLPRFLFDAAWRQEFLAHTTQREAADYFHYEFPTREGAVHQWVTPVLNKIGPLIFDPDVFLMLSTRSTIHFREILDRKMVLLVNLSKGILGEGCSAMLGAFIVAHLQQAALSRANSTRRDPFFLYLDEFHNYTTDNVTGILSESRKYGLSLILAHQYLDQLSVEIRDAVLNNTGTFACFRLGYQDATLLSRVLFPPGHSKESHQEINLPHMPGYSIPLFQDRVAAPGHEELVTRLTQLKPREFWTKRRGPYPPVKQQALNMPVPELSRELFSARRQLVETSGRKFGRLKSELRKEASDEQSQHSRHSTTYYEKP
jgi:hypothetical protein